MDAMLHSIRIDLGDHSVLLTQKWRKLKRSDIWDSETVRTRTSIWSSLDIVVNVQRLLSFGALISN